jgi:hypothetical protein
MAFVTLCGAYLGINPYHDLWKYFFHIHRPQGAEAELMNSGVRSFMSSRVTE